jgi:NitT/TauT family transport system ATP-binding protein
MQLRAPVQETTQVPLSGRLCIDRVSVRFGETLALSELSLDIAPGAFVALLGPSGCGKSTLLNAIAGFQPVTSGKIDLDGGPIKGPGADRGVVFQQPWLFPWMTVRENIAYGPRMRGLPRAEIEARADALIKVVGLAAAESRYPNQLSGGMQQRAAIARVLANDPAVLLMDEPFAALDAQTRSMMQAYLLDVWSKLPKTIVFVTHDIDEAILLSDRIVVMGTHPGRVIADLDNPLPRPRSPDLAFDARYLSIKKQCFDLIRAETLKSFAA